MNFAPITPESLSRFTAQAQESVPEVTNPGWTLVLVSTDAALVEAAIRGSSEWTSQPHSIHIDDLYGLYLHDGLTDRQREERDSAEF